MKYHCCEYAERLNEDIPRACSIRYESLSISSDEKPHSEIDKTIPHNTDIILNEGHIDLNFESPDFHSTTLGQTYEAALDIFGRFKKRSLPELDL